MRAFNKKIVSDFNLARAQSFCESVKTSPKPTNKLRSLTFSICSMHSCKASLNETPNRLSTTSLLIGQLLFRNTKHRKYHGWFCQLFQASPSVYEQTYPLAP